MKDNKICLGNDLDDRKLINFETIYEKVKKLSRWVMLKWSTVNKNKMNLIDFFNFHLLICTLLTILIVAWQ